MFDKTQLTEYSKEQARAVSMTANFLSLMGYGKPLPAGTVSFGAQYDSICANAATQGFNKEALIPKPLLVIEEALAGKFSNNGSRAFNAILDSIATGYEAHRNRNGGDIPNAGLVASALINASQLYSGLSGKNTDGIFDSLTDQNQSYKQYFLDSVSSAQSAHTAEVPTLAMVTIATTIANALPLVSYLPNPRGTQTVPLLYVRQVASKSLGQTRKNDYLDGPRAARQYFDSVHRFDMTTADNLTFTVKAARCVNVGTNTPDAASGRLPLVAGASLITIAGMPIANDEQNHRSSGSTVGQLPLMALDQDGITYKGVTYKFVSGNVNLDTDTITLVLDQALPADVKVTAHVVANYEAKDNDGKPILSAPAVDAKLEYDSVSAIAIRAEYIASIDALTQMQNELGVDMRAAFVAVVIAKLMLEQNIRLLQGARDKAYGLGAVRAFDMMRNSDMTQAFNRTADIASELIPAIEDTKRRIVGRTTHAPAGFDIFVTGPMGTLTRTLADDTNFIPSGLTLGEPNNIVRIGSRGSDNYYYIPEDAGVLEFGEESVGGKVVQFAETLVIGRNDLAAKSMFVGHIAVPVVTQDVRAEKYEEGVTFYTRQAAQQNRNKRYGAQAAILKVLNLPASLTQDA